MTKIVKNYRPFIIVFLYGFFFMFGRLSQKMTDNRLKKKHKVNEIFWISRRISGWECSRTNNAGFCWSQNLTSHLLIVYNGLVYFFLSVKKTIFEKSLSIYITVSVDVCIFEPQYDLFLFLNMIYFYFCRKLTFKNKNSHKTVSIVIKPIMAYVAKTG